MKPRKIILAIALGLLDRFRCRKFKLNRKPDAHSWAVESDFIAGVKLGMKIAGKEIPAFIDECVAANRSVATLTLNEIYKEVSE